MARMRIVKRGDLFIPLYVQTSNERDGDGVGSDDLTDKGGAIAGSADVLITDTGNEVYFSGPIHIGEPGDKNKLPDTGEAAAASDAQETTEEVHNTNQEQSESLSMFPERLPSTSQKRRQRRATTVVPGSDTEMETKKTRRVRRPNWTSEETKMLIACKSELSLPKGGQGWEEIAAKIGTRDAVQCRQRWDTLQKRGNETLTTTISSGPSANELNGASTSTHPVGKPNLPSSACPNLEVSRPQAFSVEQRPCAFEIEGWSEDEEAGIFIDSYLVPIKFKKHQKCEGSKPLLLNLWWLHVTFSFMVNYGRRFRSSSHGGRIVSMHGPSVWLGFLKTVEVHLPDLDANWLAVLEGANFHI